MMEADIILGEKPPPVVEGLKIMLKQFQEVEPELKGQIQPEESVKKALQVIEGLDATSSGLLVSHNGDRERWL